jgi:hypothetical protein
MTRPARTASDKLKILETAEEWCVVFGYPGPSSPAAGHYIIPDVMASNEIKLIYEKWAKRS